MEDPLIEDSRSLRAVRGSPSVASPSDASMVHVIVWQSVPTEEKEEEDEPPEAVHMCTPVDVALQVHFAGDASIFRLASCEHAPGPNALNLPFTEHFPWLYVTLLPWLVPLIFTSGDTVSMATVGTPVRETVALRWSPAKRTVQPPSAEMSASSTLPAAVIEANPFALRASWVAFSSDALIDPPSDVAIKSSFVDSKPGAM